MRGAVADRARLRAAVPQTRSRGGRRARRHARNRHSARPLGQHGIRRPLAKGQGRRPSGRPLARRRRSRDARPLQPQRRREHARHVRPRSAGCRRRQRESRRRLDALRSGVEAVRKHPAALHGPAARDDRDQRLPARRLDGLGGRALPRGLHRDADVGRDARSEQRRGAVGDVFTTVVLRSGARHGDSRHREPRREAAGRRRVARRRRPSDSDAADAHRAERGELGDVHAVHTRQAHREGHGARRNGSTAGRQHVSFHRGAERARVTARRRRRQSRFVVVSVESPGRQLVARVPDGSDAGRPRLAEQLREARCRDPQRRRVPACRAERRAETVRRSAAAAC